MKPIESLKARLSNDKLLVQNEKGFLSTVGFEWNPAATDKEIAEFETVLHHQLPAEFKEFLLICGPLEDVKQDIENRTFALPEMEKKKSREREYIEWSNVNVSTVNGDINYDEYFRLAD